MKKKDRLQVACERLKDGLGLADEIRGKPCHCQQTEHHGKIASRKQLDRSQYLIHV